MKGEQSAGAKKTDAHAFGIWKAGRMSGGQWINAELVCTLDVAGGCRWKDDDMLVERLDRVLRWYGDCMIVPEVNVAVNIARDLHKRGRTIYHRETFDELNPGKTTKVLGWQTTAGASGSRREIVRAIAVPIRENAVNIRYGPMIAELRTFITDKHGIDRAKNGTHDDWVMGGGIGLACLNYATTYRAPGSVASGLQYANRVGSAS